MTLIPLISAIVAAPEAITAPATAPALQPRGSYGADRTHHPFAALFAVGLPAALVVAVALSPMIVEDKPATVKPPWTSITLLKSKTRRASCREQVCHVVVLPGGAGTPQKKKK